jgi:hypothetical protein
MKISDAFLKSVKSGDLKKVKSLFKKEKPDLNKLSKSGNTLMEEVIFKMVEAKSGDDYSKIAKFLLKSGFDIHTPNLNEQSALFTAVGNKVYEMVEFCLKEGVDPNETDKWGLSPLHYACRKNDTKVIELLLKKGAKINAADGWGFTPAHEAVLSHGFEAVELLIKYKADFKKGTIKDYDDDYPKGTTAFDTAKIVGNRRIVNKLGGRMRRSKKAPKFNMHIEIEHTFVESEEEPEKPKPKPKPIKLKKKKVEGRDWTWNRNKYGHEGVHTYEGKLVWYSHKENPHAGGGASEQTFEDFLRNGPCGTGAPEKVVKELKALLKKYVKKS